MTVPKPRPSADGSRWCPTGGSDVRVAGSIRDAGDAGESVPIVVLRAAAAPVLNELITSLRDSSLCVALADQDSMIIDTRYTDQRLAAEVERIGVVPGENAPVALDEARVDAARMGYYRQSIHQPATREVAGALVVTGAIPETNPLFVPYLRHAARAIEQRLVTTSHRDERLALTVFQNEVAARARAVAVVSGNLVLTTPAAADLLWPADHARLRKLAEELPDDRPLARKLELTSGLVVQVEVSRIARTTATMIRLVGETRRGDGGFQVERQLRRLRGAHSPVVISGEPGAGRSHAVRVVAGGAPVTTLDAAEVPAVGEGAWARRLRQLAGCGDDEFIAVEEIQLLPATLCVQLATVLAESSARFVLTSTPYDDLPPYVANLAASCMYRVELPPLRHRRDELPALVQAIARDVLPGQEMTFAPSALAALSAQQWQGNLRELTMVVRYAAAAGIMGEITAADLPEVYRAPVQTRPLTPWQRAGRDAIVSALRATSGNKLQAAKRLGISRTTLYNRIRALKITV